MANSNLKIKKKKEYNPFTTKVLARFKVGKVKGYLKAIKPNATDGYGNKKLEGCRYDLQTGRVTFDKSVEMYSSDKVYFYEVGANDGSYRKCRTEDEAKKAFEMLREFEKRQTEIK